MYLIEINGNDLFFHLLIWWTKLKFKFILNGNDLFFQLLIWWTKLKFKFILFVFIGFTFSGRLSNPVVFASFW